MFSRPHGGQHECRPSALAECGPIVHEVTEFPKKIAASIGRFDRVADGMGKSLLYDVVRIGSCLSCPVSKRAAKAVDGHIALAHLLQHVRHGHVAKGRSSAGADENMRVSGLAIEGRQDLNCSWR